MKTQDKESKLYWLGIFGVLLVAALAQLKADPLQNWNWRIPELPEPEFSEIRAVTEGNGLIVAVGERGKIIISNDSSNWIRVIPPLQASLLDIVYGNGQFVAVGRLWAADGYYLRGTILISRDGVSWTERASPTNSLAAVAFGNGAFVAVGNRGTLLSSWDGTNWTARDSKTSDTLIDVAYGNNTFVAISSYTGKVITSTDAENWTLYENENINWYWGCNIAYGNGMFVALAQRATDYQVLYSSPDGAVWTGRQTNQTRYASLSPVVFGNGMFMNFADYRPLISPDGIHWNNRPWFGGILIGHALGRFWSMSQYRTWTTPDGFEWVEVNAGRSYSFESLQALTYGGGAFVAIGAASAHSTNGIEWSVRTTGSYHADLQSVTYGNGVYLAAHQHALVTSTDGLNWTTQSTVPGAYFSRVIYANGLFVALGVRSIQVSPDTTNWTVACSVGSGLWLCDVAFGNDRFVVVGHGGLVLVSSNAFDWSTNYANTTEPLRGLSFAHGLFIASTDSGIPFSSTDGSNWTSHSIGPDGAPSGGKIIFGNGQYLSPCSNGILSSSNGIDWVAHPSYYGGLIAAIACDGNTLVGLANGGLLQSEPFNAEPPMIVEQPRSPSVFPGKPAVFSVNAYGSEPLCYQWYKHSQPISGATNAIFVLQNVGALDAGDYNVIVTNALGSATSSVAVLTLKDPVLNLRLSFNGTSELTLLGPIGTSWRVEYTDNYAGPNCWQVLTNIFLPLSPTSLMENRPLTGPMRLYRARMNY